MVSRNGPADDDGDVIAVVIPGDLPADMAQRAGWNVVGGHQAGLTLMTARTPNSALACMKQSNQVTAIAL